MIKIKSLCRKLELQYCSSLKFSCEKTLSKYVKYATGEELKLFKFLYDNLDKILVGNPKQLREIIKDFQDRGYEDLVNPAHSENYLKKLAEVESKMKSERVYKSNVKTTNFDEYFHKVKEIASNLSGFAEFSGRYVKDLQKYIEKLNCFILLKRNLTKCITKVFDYDAFSKNYAKWGAYKLVEELDVKVCPYCNRSFIHTSRPKALKGKTRAELDHYYPKSLYPFLAISLYNLIPSCHICNSSLKRDIDFFKKENEHVHPYEEGFEDLDARFTTAIRKNDNDEYDLDFLNGLGKGNMELEICHDEEKVKNSLATFHIKELYQNHTDYAAEIVKKAVCYSPSRIEEIENIFKIGGEDGKTSSIFNTHEEFFRTYIGNYTEEKDLGERVLAKLTRDICHEFGILELHEKNIPDG